MFSTSMTAGVSGAQCLVPHLASQQAVLANADEVEGKKLTSIFQSVRQLGIVGIGIILADSHRNGNNNDNNHHQHDSDNDPDLARPVARIPPGHLGGHPPAGLAVHVEILVLRRNVAEIP